MVSSIICGLLFNVIISFFFFICLQDCANSLQVGAGFGFKLVNRNRYSLMRRYWTWGLVTRTLTTCTSYANRKQHKYTYLRIFQFPSSPRSLFLWKTKSLKRKIKNVTSPWKFLTDTYIGNMCALILKRNKPFLIRRADNCYRCMIINERHENVIQFREGESLHNSLMMNFISCENKIFSYLVYPYVLAI